MQFVKHRPKAAGFADVLVLEIMSKESFSSVLMLHVGLYRPKLQSQVIRKAKSEDASLVICDHSHVPFIGSGHGYTVFNPGSMGYEEMGCLCVWYTELNAGNFR